MAELGIAGSIVSIVQLGGTLTATLYSYMHKSNNAGQIICKLVDHLTSLIGVLTALEIQTRDANYNSSIIQSLRSSLAACEADLHRLHDKLSPTPNSTKLGLGQRLLWPLKQKEVMEEVGRIERAKDLFVLALSADQVALALASQQYLAMIQADVAQNLQVSNATHNVASQSLQLSSLINEGVKTAVDGVSNIRHEMHGLGSANEQQMKWQEAQDLRRSIEDEQKILEWLGNGVDVSSNHAAARKLCQEGTGLWFTESLEFKNWLDMTGKHIWLQGSVGSGKTILMSSIIDAAKKSLAQDCGLAYFYYNFNDSNKLKIVNMLRSIIRQLSMQLSAFPATVKRLYESQREGDPQENQSLLDCLKDIVPFFPKVYIFLDALDECTQMAELSSCIEFVCSLSRTRVILTSRADPKLLISLSSCTLDVMLIKSSNVDQDVKLYVEEVVKHQFQQHQQDIRDEISKKLNAGSRGMFRWVKCQLDALQRCRTPKKIRSALDHLPKTLHETYERILLSIADEDQAIARRALLFLVFSQHPPTIQELAEMMIVEIEAESLDHELRLADPNTPGSTQRLLPQILEICGSLVSQVESFGQDKSSKVQVGNPRIILAHFSVQEYLLSAELSLASSKVSLYALQHKTGNEEIMRICLTYLQYTDFQPVFHPSKEEYFARRNRYPLYYYAARYSPYHAQSIGMSLEELDVNWTHRQTDMKLSDFSGQVIEWTVQSQRAEIIQKVLGSFVMMAINKSR